VSEAYVRQRWISGRSVHHRGSRLEREEVPDIETFLLVCDWLRMAPSEFIQADEARSMNTLELIERELRTDGVLRVLCDRRVYHCRKGRLSLSFVLINPAGQQMNTDSRGSEVVNHAHKRFEAGDVSLG
jgi:hypothetical protein